MSDLWMFDEFDIQHRIMATATLGLRGLLVLPVLCSFLFFIGHHFTSCRLFKKIWCKILAPSFLF
jgi:hypothetical protein